MRSITSKKFQIALAFVAIYVIWGTTYLGIALAIRTLPPFISGGIRFVVAAALMYVWLRMRAPRPLTGVPFSQAVLTGVLLSGVGNGFVIWAQQGLPSGIAALVIAAMPVFVLLIDWAFFSRRSPKPGGLFGMLVALAGVTVIVLHGHSLSGQVRPMHVLALICAVLGWSFGTLIQRGAARSETVLSFTCSQMFWGGVFQLSLAALTGEWQGFAFANVSLLSMGALAYLVIFGSLIGLNCYLWLLTRVSAQKVTTYALVNPVIALFLGGLVLQERLNASTVFAALLVLTGVTLVLFERLNPVHWLWRLRAGRPANECRES